MSPFTKVAEGTPVWSPPSPIGAGAWSSPQIRARPRCPGFKAAHDLASVYSPAQSHMALEKSEVKVKSLSHVRLFATPWTVAYQASPSMGFSRQEYHSVLPFPSPGDLPDPGMEPRPPTLQAEALPSESPGKPHMATASLKSHSPPCPTKALTLPGTDLTPFPLCPIVHTSLI